MLVDLCYRVAAIPQAESTYTGVRKLVHGIHHGMSSLPVPDLQDAVSATDYFQKQLLDVELSLQKAIGIVQQQRQGAAPELKLYQVCRATETIKTALHDMAAIEGALALIDYIGSRRI